MPSAPERIQTVANVRKVIDLFAKQYEDNPKVVLRELVQNSADATTQHLRRRADSDPRITVEIIPESDRRRFGYHIVVRDNAAGMTVEQFTDYLVPLGETSKLEDIDAIGQFGIGFYAIVVACTSALVVSKAESHDQPVISAFTSISGWETSAWT